MSALESFLAGQYRPGAALVQVTLVALLGLLVWLAARRRGPALQGAVLLAALVGAVAVPALAVVAPVCVPLPDWMCPVVAASTTVTQTDAAPKFLPSAPSSPPVLALLVPQGAGGPPDMDGDGKQLGETTPAKAEVVLLDASTLPEDVPAAARSATRDPSTARPPATGRLAGTLAALWLFGAVVYLGRAVVCLVLLYRRAWLARPVREPEWTGLLALLRKCYGLPPIALLESSAIETPLTMGLFRPAILLPPGRRHWPVEQRALILTHELAHIQRRDFLAGLLAELVACLWWFHPLVRWLASRLRLEQEYAADACVASASADPTDYIRCLARLALGLRVGFNSLAPALWRRRPEILRRIDMLRSHPNGQPPHLGKRTACVVAVLAMAAWLAVACIGPVPPGEATAAPPPAPAKDQAKAPGGPLADRLPAGALARLGTTRMRHDGDVTFVAFGPGEKTLLTAGQDNTIRLWDMATGNELKRFARPKPLPPKPAKPDPKKEQAQLEELVRHFGQGGGGSFSVALAPAAKVLAASGANVIQIWEVETGKELRQIEVPGGGIAGLLFSPDGRVLAARIGNGALLVWEVESGKLLHDIKLPTRETGNMVVLAIGGDGGDAPGMAFTPDSKALVGAATEYKKEEAAHSVKFWDLASGKELHKVPVPGGVNVSGVALSPDGKLVAYGAGDSIHLCEVSSGTELRKLRTGRVISAAFTPDGKALAVRARNQRLRLWDVETGKELHQLSDADPPPQGMGGLAFVIVGAFSGPEVRALAFSPDGKQIAAAAGSTVRLWDVASGKEVHLSEGHWRPPSAIVLSPDGKAVVSWGPDRMVRRWDGVNGKSLGAFAAPRETTLAVFSPDGRVVALANTDNTVRLHETATGKELSQIKGRTAGTASLAFTPDSKVLAARGNDDVIRLYDAGRGADLRQISIRPALPGGTGGNAVIILGGRGRGPRGTAPGLAFSPDGRLLVTPVSGRGNSGNALAVFDVATGKELRKIMTPQRIATYAFAPDGRTLAAENGDRTLTLWEVASGKERGHLGKAAEPPPQEGNRITVGAALNGAFVGGSDPAGPIGVTFSPDGRAILVRGPTGGVAFWDVVAGKEISQLQGHAGRVETVAIATTGKVVATGGSDTTILLWDATAPMKGLSRPASTTVRSEEMEALWHDLASSDAAQALKSEQKLSTAAGQVVPFLSAHLKPAARIDTQKINRLIADLDSDTYTVRRAAVGNLLKVGEQAVPALQKVLASSPPLETRMRAEELLEQLTRGNLSTDQLQVVRAVEVLEHLDSPDARRLLHTLAEGAPGALPTREAEAALARMSKDR
jgi:WD40 repeat protein/beta-lactamase regulating signal transducer with metallopeptidase domain